MAFGWGKHKLSRKIVVLVCVCFFMLGHFWCLHIPWKVKSHSTFTFKNASLLSVGWWKWFKCMCTFKAYLLFFPFFIHSKIWNKTQLFYKFNFKSCETMSFVSLVFQLVNFKPHLQKSKDTEPCVRPEACDSSWCALLWSITIDFHKWYGDVAQLPEPEEKTTVL